MTKKLKNLSLSLTCVRQLLAADGTPLVAEATFPSQGNPRQREPSVYGRQIKSAAVYKAFCLVHIFVFADAEIRLVCHKTAFHFVKNYCLNCKHLPI